jgi:hypothetical protein
MLGFTQHPGKPSLRLLVHHDDGQREFDYISGAEQGAGTGRRGRLDDRQHETTGPPSSDTRLLGTRSPGTRVASERALNRQAPLRVPPA